MNEDDQGLNPQELPIYKKGVEIYEVVKQITDLIPKDNDQLQHTKEMLLSDAAQLTVKVAGAESAGFYDMKMEAAAIIRKSARDLMVQNHALRMFGFKEVAYFDIVRSFRSPDLTFEI